VAEVVKAPSARRTELLERAYEYVLTHGITEMSLRPLAGAIGSSPRVLILLFGSKDGLVRALLDRARADEHRVLGQFRTTGRAGAGTGTGAVVAEVWQWLALPAHRPLLILWAQAYVQSLTDPAGPWAGFAQATVQDWLELLLTEGSEQATLSLAVLRGALLDLLATGETARTTDAVSGYVGTLS
jgi:AcrR family transcriptional regulator